MVAEIFTIFLPDVKQPRTSELKVGWENNIAIETYAMLLHNSIRNSARLTPRAFDFAANSFDKHRDQASRVAL